MVVGSSVAGDTGREHRLRAAIRVASNDPPTVISGDLLGEPRKLAASAPREATLVVFDSAVMPYLSPEDRARFIDVVS